MKIQINYKTITSEKSMNIIHNYLNRFLNYVSHSPMNAYLIYETQNLTLEQIRIKTKGMINIISVEEIT